MKNLIIVLLTSGITLAANAQTVHSHTTVSTQQNPDGSTHTSVNRQKHVVVHHRARVRSPRVTVKKTTTTTSATVK
jgi:hypothetical protein